MQAAGAANRKRTRAVRITSLARTGQLLQSRHHTDLPPQPCCMMMMRILQAVAELGVCGTVCA